MAEGVSARVRCDSSARCWTPNPTCSIPIYPKRLPQQPVASALGIEPTEEKIATSMKAIANAEAVGPEGLPTELLELGFQQDRTILLELHRLTTLLWREGKVPQQ